MLNYLKKNCHINLLFLITIIINGCAYHNIEELKSTPNISNQFSQALSESYLEFAIYEMNEMHDEIDAAYFAKKGLKARKGEKVLPELVREKKMGLIDDKKYLTVDYDKMVPVLLEAIKELTKRVKELEGDK